jgi:hypothetical protein
MIRTTLTLTERFKAARMKCKNNNVSTVYEQHNAVIYLLAIFSAHGTQIISVILQDKEKTVGR